MTHAKSLQEVTMQADTELVRNLKTMKSLSDRLQKVRYKLVAALNTPHPTMHDL